MDSNKETGTGTGTGTAPATNEAKLHAVTDDQGAVKLGVWKNVPGNYTPLQTKDEIVDALMNFNATELRLLIADLCVSGI